MLLRFAPDRVPEAAINIAPAVRACIRYGLTGRLPLSSGGSIWRDGLPQLLEFNLASYAVRAIASQGIETEPETAEALSASARQGALLSLTIERSARPVLERLHESNISFVIIKGPAAARFYPTSGNRAFTDLDLVIPPDQYRAATEIAQEEGFCPDVADEPPWPIFSRLAIEGTNLKGTAPGQRIDLHHHISPLSLTRDLSADMLIGNAQRSEVMGVPVLLASPVDSFLVASLHVLNDLWKNQPAVWSWLDAAHISRQVSLAEISTRFEQVRLSWYLPVFLAALNDLAGLTSEEGPAAKLSMRRRVRLLALGWNGSRIPPQHPLKWALRLPLPLALLFAAGSLVPSRDYVTRTHGGYLRYWRRGITELRQSQA